MGIYFFDHPSPHSLTACIAVGVVPPHEGVLALKVLRGGVRSASGGALHRRAASAAAAEEERQPEAPLFLRLLLQPLLLLLLLLLRRRRFVPRGLKRRASHRGDGGRGRRRRQGGAIIAHYNMKGALRRQRGIVRFLCSEQSVMCKPSVVIHIVRGGLLIA